MNVLRQLSIRNLKLNKKRTISTTIGIILSVALICAVSCMGETFKATLVENATNETGYYHVEISDIGQTDIENIKNNRDVKDIYEIINTGYGKLENSQNENKPYVEIYSMNDKTFDNLKFKLKEGRFASNNNEIVISDHIRTNGKVDWKIGDEITLKTGKRMLDGQELNRYNPYDNKEYKEEFKINETKKFKIVGIIERPGYDFEGYSSPGYTVITNGINGNQKDIYVSLKKPLDYKKSIPELLGAKDYEKVKKYDTNGFKYTNYNLNEELLRWEAFSFSDSTVTMLYSVIGVVIFIIIFTSVFCIRNSFAISTIEKMKMYGMLASIGATKKQIRKNVISEAMILSLIGIPLGIASGIFAVFVLMKIVNLLIGKYLLSHVDGMVFTVSIFPILMSIVLGLITIYLSAIASAKKASKVSPIDNLRSSNDVKISRKRLKIPKLIGKVFKIGGILAYKNLKRSKKKYRTTVISLAVSIFIFISMNAFINNAFGLSNYYYKEYNYNFKIYSTSENITNDQISKIITCENVKEYFILYEKKDKEYLKITDIDKVNRKESMEDEEDSNTAVISNNQYMPLELMALDDNTFKKYCEKIGANYEQVKDKGILIDNLFEESGDGVKEVRTYNYNENDTITGKYNDKTMSFTVGKVTNIRPYGIENSYYYGGYLVLNIDEFRDIDFVLDQISIDAKDGEKLLEELKNHDLDLQYTDLAESAKEENAMILVVKIFLYGFITVITLIGVTNIFNTITSNMELRQKEFAMLKSIGMTKREFNGMINLETLFYGVKSWIYGVILGLLGTIAMYKAFSVKLDRGMYIPIKPIIISGICVFILVFIIMKYSISKINKQNTIETIRKENI